MATSTLQMVDGTVGALSDPTGARAKQRYLQKARLLPALARAYGPPQIEALHGAVWVTAILWPGRQSHVTYGVQRAFWLPPHGHAGWRHPALRQSQALEPHTDPNERRASFGQVLEQLIDVAASSPEGRAGVENTLAAIELTHDGQVGAVTYRDGRREEYRGPLLTVRPSPDGRGPLVDIISRCRVEFLVLVASMVAATRYDAARLGITVDVSEAYQALGAEPGGPPPTSSSDGESDAPKAAEAEGGGAPSTSDPDQPGETSTGTAPTSRRQFTEAGGRGQSSFNRRAGHPPQHGDCRDGTHCVPAVAA